MTGEGLVAERSVALPSGARMPLLGLGTWQARGRSAVEAVRSALAVGYRHVDTATVYGNEREVGRAIASSGVRREDVFVTTKLPQSNAGRERATLEESLAALGLGYVDLWLIHWPPGGQARPDVWERLLELKDEGLARDVGVSNYGVGQLDELGRATGRLPAVNQIERTGSSRSRDRRTPGASPRTRRSSISGSGPRSSTRSMRSAADGGPDNAPGVSRSR